MSVCAFGVIVHPMRDFWPLLLMGFVLLWGGATPALAVGEPCCVYDLPGASECNCIDTEAAAKAIQEIFSANDKEMNTLLKQAMSDLQKEMTNFYEKTILPDLKLAARENLVVSEHFMSTKAKMLDAKLHEAERTMSTKFVIDRTRELKPDPITGFAATLAMDGDMRDRGQNAARNAFYAAFTNSRKYALNPDWAKKKVAAIESLGGISAVVEILSAPSLNMDDPQTQLAVALHLSSLIEGDPALQPSAAELAENPALANKVKEQEAQRALVALLSAESMGYRMTTSRGARDGKDTGPYLAAALRDAALTPQDTAIFISSNNPSQAERDKALALWSASEAQLAIFGLTGTPAARAENAIRDMERSSDYEIAQSGGRQTILLNLMLRNQTQQRQEKLAAAFMQHRGGQYGKMTPQNIRQNNEPKKENQEFAKGDFVPPSPDKTQGGQ